MDCIVHGAAKSQTRLSNFHFHVSQDNNPFKERAELSCFSRVCLCVTQWTGARQASLSMGFSRQEYWSGLPFPSPGDLLDPRIKPQSPTLWAISLPPEPSGKPR